MQRLRMLVRDRTGAAVVELGLAAALIAASAVTAVTALSDVTAIGFTNSSTNQAID